MNNESLSKEKKLAVPSSSSSPPRKLPVQMKSENQTRVIGDYVHVRKTSLGTSKSNDKEVSLSSTFVSQVTIGSKIEIQKPSPPRLTERSMAQVAMLLRPSSAPLVLGGPRPIIFVVSKVQIAPLLARSMSAIGRLGPDPSPYIPSFFFCHPIFCILVVLDIVVNVKDKDGLMLLVLFLMIIFLIFTL